VLRFAQEQSSIKAIPISLKPLSVNRCQNPGAHLVPNFPGARDPPNRVGHPSETGQDPQNVWDILRFQLRQPSCLILSGFPPFPARRTPQNAWDIPQKPARISQNAWDFPMSRFLQTRCIEPDSEESRPLPAHLRNAGVHPYTCCTRSKERRCPPLHPLHQKDAPSSGYVARQRVATFSQPLQLRSCKSTRA
jgi:hypothetical protein